MLMWKLLVDHCENHKKKAKFRTEKNDKQNKYDKKTRVLSEN